MSNRVKRDAKQIAKTGSGEIIQQSMSITREGILPPPEELAKYEEIRPGITEVLLKSYTEQSQHRMELEKAVVYTGAGNTRRGQAFAFILSLIVIIGGFGLILLDKNIFGITAILGSLATLVGVFIYGNKSKKKERIQKSRDNP